MANGKNARVRGSIAWFIFSSACGGSIFLGSNDRDAGASGAEAGDIGPGMGNWSLPDSAPAAPNASMGNGGGEGSAGGQIVGVNGAGDANANVAAVTVLATGQLSPTSIAVDANNVYWVNEGMPPPSPCTTCSSDNDCSSQCGPVPQTGYHWCCVKPQGLCASQSFSCPDAGSSGGSEGGIKSSFGPVQILKCAKSGCNNHPTVLASDVSDSGDGGRLRGLAVDGANVYWTSAKALYACAITGCNSGPMVLHRVVGANQGAGVPDVPPEISAIGQTVYASDPGAVYSDSASARGAVTLFSGGNTWMWVTADSNNVYFGTLNLGIASCPLRGCGGAPTSLSPADMTSPVKTLLGQIVVDNANLYWGKGAPASLWLSVANGFVAACPSGNTSGIPDAQILKCAKGGCNGAPSEVASGLDCPLGMATDGANVYFTEPQYFGAGNPMGVLGNASNGRIAKCAVSGCSNQAPTLVSGVNNPRGIAVDEAHIYWADFGSGGTVPSSPTQSPPYSNDGRIMMMAK